MVAARMPRARMESGWENATMERYTISDADCATVRLAATLGIGCIPMTKRGKDCAKALKVERPTFDDGGYTGVALVLDAAACYGGYRVEVCGPGTSGHWTPFGDARMGARELCGAIRYVEGALRLLDGSGVPAEWVIGHGAKAGA